MGLHALDQIVGGANQPGQQNLASAVPPNPGTGPQLPQGPQVPAAQPPGVSPVAGQVLDPQQQAMQQAAIEADALYTREFGESFLQKMQAGQATPQEEQKFTQIIQAVLTGQTTGVQEFNQTQPGGILG